MPDVCRRLPPDIVIGRRRPLDILTPTSGRDWPTGSAGRACLARAAAAVLRCGVRWGGSAAGGVNGRGGAAGVTPVEHATFASLSTSAISARSCASRWCTATQRPPSS